MNAIVEFAQSIDKSIQLIDKSIEKYIANGIQLGEAMRTDMKADRDASRKDMKAFNAEFSNSLKGLTNKLEGYIENDSKAIEDEINERMTAYLKISDKFKNKYIYNLNKEWKFLNVPEFTKSKWKNKEQITEFDGLYLVSDYKLDNVIIFNKLIREPTQNAAKVQKESKEIFFIVLEGKHTTDTERIKQKLIKLDYFKDYIQKAKVPNFNSDLYTMEFLEKIDTYHLKEVSTDPMYIYFAGPRLLDSAIEYIINNKDTFKNKEVNYMKPDGSQYTIYDNYYEYKPYKFSAQNKLVIAGVGGKKKKDTKKHTNHN